VAINAWWEGDPTETYWMEITDRDDLGGELWAPKFDASGTASWSYTLVSHVQPRDRVFHWHKSLGGEPGILGWSEASGPLYSDTREWLARGTAGRARGVPTTGPTWVMPLKGFQRLAAPVLRSALNTEYYADVVAVLDGVEREAGGPTYAPFQRYGGRELRAQQGYLTKFPAALVALLFPSEASIDARPGGELPRRERRQAYVSDALRRASIERHAVEVAKAHYLSLGASDITELGKPYDLRVQIDGKTRHVEVKGSTIADIEEIQVTQGEVIHARNWEMTDLVVVDGIRAWEGEDGNIETDGGVLRVWRDWVPADHALTPTQLRYRLP
jgi:hypothetical protein